MAGLVQSDEHYIDSTWVVYGVRLVGGIVRYVGLTTQGVVRRFFYNHKRKAYLEGQAGAFYDWLRKYSIDDFEVVILSVCFEGDYESLNLLEQYWIDQFRGEFGSLKDRVTINYLLNQADGGQGHVSTGEDHWNYGLARPQETRDRISQTRLARKIPSWSAGKSRPELLGSGNPFYGKNHSEDTRDRMSQSSHNRWHTSRNITKAACKWC